LDRVAADPASVKTGLSLKYSQAVPMKNKGVGLLCHGKLPMSMHMQEQNVMRRTRNGRALIGLRGSLFVSLQK
jgi:hypothetical protein